MSRRLTYTISSNDLHKNEIVNPERVVKDKPTLCSPNKAEKIEKTDVEIKKTKDEKENILEPTLSCKNLDSRSKKSRRNENSKSWYENENGFTVLSSKDGGNFEKKCNKEVSAPIETSTTKYFNLNEKKGKDVTVEDKSENQKVVGYHGQRPRQSTPQADR